MTDQEWEVIALLLSKGWKGDYGPGEDRAYRSLLDGYDSQQIIRALRILAARGTPFLPAASEIVQAIEQDPNQPTFEEAFTALFDGHVFRTQPLTGTYDNEAEMLTARANHASDRAWNIHPLLGAFVDEYGPQRLRMLEVNHPEHGALVRKDLRGAWERFVEANAHRDAAMLASGRRRVLVRGPRRFDPAALMSASREESSDGNDDDL